MPMNRRRFLTLTAAGLLLGTVRAQASGGTTLWMGCRSDAGGHHFLTGFDEDGGFTLDIPLPGRGHGTTVRPGGRECVVFARRPGNWLWVARFDSGDVVRRIECPEDRHYFGHGVFDPEGRYLFVTENAFETGQGIVGVYDATDGYRRVGEFPSHGIGPHELKLLSDGRTLAIANGGIRTHPDLGRAKLNLDHMDPNLAYVDSADGRLLGAYRPPDRWHQLSIRHLDVTADDQVMIGMQYQGRADARPPLVAMHQGGQDLQLLSAPEDIQARMRNYCGSVCADPQGAWFAVSSPRGNLVTLWSLECGELTGTLEVMDGCGVAPDATRSGLVVTSGAGGVVRHRPLNAATQSLNMSAEGGIRWDNHLTARPNRAV